MIVRSCRTFVSRGHRPVYDDRIPMFRFRFLAGDAVAAVLTYSSSSSTALLSYQPGAKVPARSKVGYGLTRSSATLAFDSRMCIIGCVVDTRRAEKLAAGACLQRP